MLNPQYLKKITVTALLIILVLVLVLYIKNKQHVNKIPGLEITTTKESNTLNKNPSINKDFNLEIRDNKLTINNKLFIFQGVTSNYFRYQHGETFFSKPEDLISSVKTVHSWGVNTLQFYIRPDLFDPNSPDAPMYTRELDEVINWCLQNGIWVILDPVNDVPWKAGLAVRTDAGILRRDAITGLLENLSKNFGHYPNVLFGVEAEPKFIDSITTLNDRINIIKKYTNKPIMLPLVNFSGSVKIPDILDDGLDAKNIIIDVHPYPGQNLKYPAKSNLSLNDLIRPDIYGDHPVVFGEFGGFWEEDFNTPEDIIELKKVGQIAKENNISLIAYALDDNLISLFDKNGNINVRGEAVKQLFLNAP